MIQFLFLAYYWIQEKFLPHKHKRNNKAIMDCIECDNNCMRYDGSLKSKIFIWFLGDEKVINPFDTSITKYEWLFKFNRFNKNYMKCNGL